MLRTLLGSPILLLAATSHTTPPPRILATAASLYDEDALLPRPVAAVQAALVAEGETLRLEVTVSATGAGVDPVPGFDGVPDVNLRTAEELERLLTTNGLQWVTRHAGRNEAGELLRIERAALPARRVETAGRVQRTTTPASLPHRVTFRSAPLPTAASCCYLLCEGMPRLSVQVEATASGHALTIRSIAEPALRVEARR